MAEIFLGVMKFDVRILPTSFLIVFFTFEEAPAEGLPSNLEESPGAPNFALVLRLTSSD